MCDIQYKGGHSELLARMFIFTSPLHPSEVYPNLGADLKEQFFRHFTSGGLGSGIFYKSKNGEPAPPLGVQPDLTAQFPATNPWANAT